MTERLKFIAVTHDILGDVFWEVFRRGLFDAAQRYGSRSSISGQAASRRRSRPS